MFCYGALYLKSQSAVFMLTEKLSLEQSVGDVRITQLDWKRVPQARSRGCKSSVAITTECSKQTGGLVSTTGCIVYTLLNRGERNMQETFLVALQVTDFISDV